MEFLLTVKALSTPWEKPCQTDYFGAMRVCTPLHSDSFTIIYVQRHGRVYVSYNFRAFSENNVNNWNIFKNFTKNFWRPSANIDLYTFKIRSVQKQFQCQQFPHVMEFLLTEKDLSTPWEKPCQTDWMEFAEAFLNKLSADKLPAPPTVRSFS